MNTIIAVSITPMGVGDELAPYIADVILVIEKSGLPYRTHSIFTEIEGEWDAVMQVVKDATFVLAEKGIRTVVNMKADIRPGYTNRMQGKLDDLNRALESKRGK